ncbi:MAG: type II toxin-antitoxin system HicA family toxin [Deltaproteobacteria bacterium]|nr:type II toxin-antitoxin system HicA family toxin [Deltaproteobacteria bacterium]
MPKLPLISAKAAIKAFEKLDYQIIRQKGSHIRMRHKTNKGKQPLTIPNHAMLGKGLLRKLLRDAEITVEDFLNLL